MQVIDFEKKGQTVRFYLGDNDLDNYYGDDWDDTPYEHNAGRVYDDFYKKTVDITFDFDDIVLEPADDWHNDGNSRYCKDDMKARKVPCIVVVPHETIDDGEAYDFVDDFYHALAHDKCIKIYFGDSEESLKKL